MGKATQKSSLIKHTCLVHDMINLLYTLKTLDRQEKLFLHII